MMEKIGFLLVLKISEVLKMKKYKYIKEGNRSYTIGKLKDIEEIQSFLKKKGLYVSFHPKTLNIHHTLDEDDYEYLMSCNLIK